MATYKEAVLCFKNLSRLSLLETLNKLGAEVVRGYLEGDDVDFNEESFDAYFKNQEEIYNFFVSFRNQENCNFSNRYILCTIKKLNTFFKVSFFLNSLNYEEVTFLKDEFFERIEKKINQVELFYIDNDMDYSEKDFCEIFYNILSPNIERVFIKIASR
ncbi:MULTISPECIES: hypothetical protein [Chryseobacterium]|uniref:Uncharacterized protein n=1 Tax=Chryseobacterium rhizosphaerae TaxID=395937 RepID=A0ABX9IGD1_9FLAO|nr:MULTISPECIES: hypothetical protein [Chryseobacterium]MCQ9636750.1 hypothetical protein [Chryseobacterium sp. WG23]MDC8100606.1 hypothetical protein [Chryseobacterium rhizosphaerae]REC73106.1 hypothetical protein DRF57_18110 [Chryseobacterium rhizosphaerae]CAH0250339.1 hypothetical protein SRABI04_03214 [Chryseobacterium sp. Bi04]GEN67717.1 hypothetical protein CRH01_22850 [Chryseobacterium rhizosphaerae]